jgi:hypothetical protein
MIGKRIGRDQELSSGKHFALRDGVVLNIKGKRISNKTINDTMAVEILNKYPMYKKYFQHIPAWYLKNMPKPKLPNRNLNVWAICFVYNELKYLPHVVNFWRNEGVKLYVIDNYSNDGTWEYLQKNNIPSHRFDTKEMFELAWLQAEVVKTLHRIKPDWVIYCAADLYIGFEKPIKKVIDEVDALDYNQIRTHCWFGCNTGEKRKLPLMDNYFFCKPFSDIILISKYDKGIKFAGDHIRMPRARPKFVDGLILNYGNAKSKEEQEVKLARRQKAWDNGLTPVYGTHYRSGKSIDWVYDSKTLVDIRAHDFKKYLENIKKSCG